MAFLKFTDKIGPGVNKGETNKKRFFYFWEIYFRKIGKLIQLNLLYLVCCLPIITIGPATAGLTYILKNFAEEKPVFLVSDFFSAFKSNFKQGVGLFLFDALTSGIALFAFYWYCTKTQDGLKMVLAVLLCSIIVIILTCMRFYTYPILVTIELPLKYIIKNAFLFTFIGFKTNIITFLITTLIVLPSVWLFPYSLVFYLIIGCSTLAFYPIFNCFKYIQKYIIDPQKTDEEEQPEEEALFSDTLLDQELKPNEILPGIPRPVDTSSVFTDQGSQEEPYQPSNVKKKNRIIR